VRLLLAIVLLGAACARPNPSYEGRFDSAVPPADAGSLADVGRDTATLIDVVVPTDAAGPIDVAGAADAVPASALLGHWTFEEPTGDLMVLDQSGHDHHGRLENLNASSARVPGKRGMALSFPSEAVNPGAMVPVASSPIRTLQRFTVAAWVYRTQLQADDEMGIVSRQIGTGPRQVFNLGFVDDELKMTLSQPSGSDLFSLTSGNAKTAVDLWIHVAATWSGSELVLYLDGQRVAGTTRSWTLPDDANPLYLGTNKNDNNDEPLVGNLDDVRLYSIALTAGQIAALASDRDP
jgi:hypothetical protein